MHLEPVNQHIETEHGVICSYPDDFFGYFGWPTVTRMDNGRGNSTLIVAASGLRNAHICPFGRTVICKSTDNGRTWTSPTVVNDLPLDDRDAGIISLGQNRLLLSWFTSDTRKYPIYTTYQDTKDQADVQRYANGFRRITDETVARWLGSWVRTSQDGGETWGSPVRVKVTAPHGPIQMPRGTLLYLGKLSNPSGAFDMRRKGGIIALKSDDDGQTWRELGPVPLHPGTVGDHYHEPHVVALPDGKLLGLIRLQNKKPAPRLETLGLVHFSLMQTISEDGGQSWSPAHPLAFHGSPPHLLCHSSGTLVAVYGYRQSPFGQRAMLSHDGGTTWTYDYILRDDGPDGDLGYPSSVELDDGSILTVYYQKRYTPDEPCSLLWTRWRLAHNAAKGKG
jgi:hypothetical protein